MGSLLVAGGPPAKADLIVVMRGDEEFYDRALTAARLFREGFAPAVYVSSALTDKGSQQLRARGIEMPSGQENIVSVLRQSGVPCDRIILGRGAGGGTEGEMRRVLLIRTGSRRRVGADRDELVPCQARRDADAAGAAADLRRDPLGCSG